MAAPIKHTCPDIDKAIKLLKQAMKIADKARTRHERNSDDDDDYYSIESGLSDVEDILEALRRSNNELREWGERLENDLQTAGEEINHLETQLEDAKQSA